MESLPNEIENIIKDYVIFKPKTKEELQDAVDLWCDNKCMETQHTDLSPLLYVVLMITIFAIAI